MLYGRGRKFALHDERSICQSEQMHFSSVQEMKKIFFFFFLSHPGIRQCQGFSYNLKLLQAFARF